MTTITLNNENQTKITFEYEHGLPYKKSIRPLMEYGEWTKNDKITLLKIMLSDNEYSLFSNPNNIEILNIYQIKNEFWIDLNDVYLIIPREKDIVSAINNNTILITFNYNKKIISSLGVAQ